MEMAEGIYYGKEAQAIFKQLQAQAGGDGGDHGKGKKAGGNKTTDQKPKLTGLDASAAAAKAPAAIDRSKFGFTLGPAPPDDGKRSYQVVGYNGESGNGTEALGSPYDPKKHTIYLDNDAMFALGLPAGYLETLEPSEMLKSPGTPFYLKEKGETDAEPDDGEKFAPNASYTGGDGIHTWTIRTNENGHIKDSIKYNPVTNKDDTIPKRKK
jgi:hypothetical protein